MFNHNQKIGMRDVMEITQNMPGFLSKIWNMVDDPETDELIGWSPSNQSFIITNQAQFAKEILPVYFKHNNMASFIRQLNMYGFHKVVSVDSGSLKSEKDEMEFAHPFFIKDKPFLLSNIKRKKGNALPSLEEMRSSGKAGDPELLSKVLLDVNHLKTKQESWDARLNAMKLENEALWRELAVFRQKHLKQEQIINKLIHFIVTMVQPSSRNVPLGRRYPLMINDTRHIKKIKKLNSNDASNMNHGSPTGPTIHEIDSTDMLLSSPEEAVPGGTEDEFIIPDLSVPDTSIGIVMSPESVSSPKTSRNERVTEPSSSPMYGLQPDATEWLDLQLLQNPMTPVNPAEVNPTVAAATIEELSKSNLTASSLAAKTGKQKVFQKIDNISSRLSQPNKKKLRRTSNAKPSKSISQFSQKRVNNEVTGNMVKDPSEILLDLVKESSNNDTSDLMPLLEVDGQPMLTINKAGKKGIKKQDIAEPETASSFSDVDLSNLISSSSKLKAFGAQTNSSSAMTPSNSKSTDDNKNKDPALGSSLLPVMRPHITDSDLTRELGDHVDNVQTDLDILKDLLKNEVYNIDANTFLGLFNGDLMAYGMPPADDQQKTTTGNEVITYNTSPNIMDLTDILSSSNDWPVTLKSPDPSNSDPSGDLLTPQPTPLAPDFSPAAKKRKK